LPGRHKRLLFQELTRASLNGYVSGMADARERMIRISSQIGDDATANKARRAHGGNLVVSASAQRELVNAAKVEAKRWIHSVEDRCRRVLLNALGSQEYDQELIALQLGDVVRSYLEQPRGEAFAARRAMKVRDKERRAEYERTKMPYLKALRTGQIIDDAIAGEKARSKNKRLSTVERAIAAANANRLKAAKDGENKPPRIARRWETAGRTEWNQSYNRALKEMAQQNEATVYLQVLTARETHIGDGQPCEICEGYELLTLPKDHPRWGTHSPLYHYACRCILAEITEAMAAAYGIKPTPKTDQPDWEGDHEPAEGFGGSNRTIVAEKTRFVKAEPESIISGIKSLPNDLKPFVTSYTPKQYAEAGSRCYLSKSGASGYAVKPDGDITSVFSAPEAHEGLAAVRSAIQRGGTKLDCFDGKLPKFYARLGFREYDRVKWDDRFAPENWNYQKWGRPDIVFMKLPSHKEEK
jgi:hypothetical protein